VNDLPPWNETTFGARNGEDVKEVIRDDKQLKERGIPPWEPLQL